MTETATAAHVRVFDQDAVFYAEAIEKAGWEVRLPLESVGRRIMAVFVDIYGDEARELIPAEQFGVTNDAEKPKPKGEKRKKGTAR